MLQKRVDPLIPIRESRRALQPDASAALARELGEVNDYAGQFHHDTNPNNDSALVVDAELLLFARRVLNLIYQNG